MNLEPLGPSPHLQEDAYAVPVRELIEERTGRPVARGALYDALASMTKGLESILEQ